MMYKLGWEAASYGERRDWCETYGPDCLKGWDAYWWEFEGKYFN